MGFGCLVPRNASGGVSQAALSVCIGRLPEITIKDFYSCFVLVFLLCFTSGGVSWGPTCTM